MKKLLILVIALALGASLNAQQYIYTFANDTVSADTNTYPSLTGKIKAASSTGLLSFQFTKVDVTDSLSFARIEGSDNGTTWTILTDNAALVNTTTDGTTKLYLSTPLLYLYYRVRIACAAGDRVAVTSPTLIYKDR
jgi:hypothetical protein